MSETLHRTKSVWLEQSRNCGVGDRSHGLKFAKYFWWEFFVRENTPVEILLQKIMWQGVFIIYFFGK